MKYLSVCSGIEAATVAWHPLGWQAVGYSEIEKFPSQVLAHHYPDVTNYGDMTKFKEWSIDTTVDLLVGGTPCQSFSVAGLRKGLDDPRGNLMLTYLAIADKFKPKWLVWENVPGVLSSNEGKDFGVFLGALGELGYGFAYRILDAQYFGVAQRRRRVFVVGYLGDWRCAAAVLFERHSLSGDLAPRREKRQGATASSEDCTDVSKCLTARGAGSQNRDPETSNLLPIELAENTIGRQPENGGNGDGFTDGGPMYTLNATGVHGVAQPIFFEPRSPDGVPRIYPMEGAAPTLNTMGGGQREPCVTHSVAQAMAFNIAPGKGILKDDIHVTNADATKTLDASGSNPAMHQGGAAILQAMAVRRLTPIECERLQGFGDNYTDIQPKGKPTPDGPRYKALGNSMAVPVMAWIGKRIQEVERLSERNG
jgi:DNA (cytosine-5)-methyltransferase 1